MSPAQKKAKRQAKHEVFKTAKMLITRRLGLVATAGQLNAFSKKTADKYFSVGLSE